MNHFTLEQIELMIAENKDGKRPMPARISRILDQLRATILELESERLCHQVTSHALVEVATGKLYSEA